MVSISLVLSAFMLLNMYFIMGLVVSCMISASADVFLSVIYGNFIFFYKIFCTFASIKIE